MVTDIDVGMGVDTYVGSGMCMHMDSSLDTINWEDLKKTAATRGVLRRRRRADRLDREEVNDLVGEGGFRNVRRAGQAAALVVRRGQCTPSPSGPWPHTGKNQ